MTRPLRISFALQSFAMVTVTASSSMMAVMVPLYAAQLGLGASWIGVLVALPSVFPVLMAMAAGRWIDGFGAARWFFIGIVGMTSAPAIVLLAPGVAALALSRAVTGLFQLFVVLSSQSLVASLGNGRSHQSNFAVYSTMLAIGRLLGPLIAGVAIDWAGFLAGFAATMVMLALGAVAAYLLRRWAVPETGEAARMPPGGTRQAMGAVLGNVGLQLAILSSSGVFLAITVRQAFLPIMLQDQGWTATAIGGLVSLGAMTAVLIRPVMPWVVRALGGVSRTLVAAMLAVAVGVGALGLVSTLPAFAVLAVLVGFGTGVGFPLSIVTVASHVPREHRGLALGLRLSSNHTVEIVAPVLGGLLIAASGFGVGFAVAGGALLLLGVLALARVRPFEAAEAEAEADAAASAERRDEPGEEEQAEPPRGR